MILYIASGNSFAEHEDNKIENNGGRRQGGGLLELLLAASDRNLTRLQPYLSAGAADLKASPLLRAPFYSRI